MMKQEQILARLRNLITQAQRGIDIAPAQIHRFEGYLRACLEMDAEMNADRGTQAEKLVKICRQLLPANCTLAFDSVRDEFIFTMPQIRAPVYPSTKD